MTRLPLRVLLAGGGTGGHLFPALAVAEKLRILKPDTEFLFIGKAGKIEERVVPRFGIAFQSIPAEGLSRKSLVKNIVVLVKFLAGFIKSLLLCMTFKPHVAVGTGGYTTAAPVLASKVYGAKVVLLESNSHPGVTIKLLQRFADQIHVAFKDTVKYLKAKEKVVVSGNPLRSTVTLISREKAVETFGLNPNRKTVLVLGGSQGASAINTGVSDIIQSLRENSVQMILQTGQVYFEDMKLFAGEGVVVVPFIDDMQSAFSAADVIISRSGATTVAEIATLGKAAILIPSPNVAENHQYFNAKAMADENAAILIEEKELKEKLESTLLALLSNTEQRNFIEENCKKFSHANSAENVARMILQLTENN